MESMERSVILKPPMEMTRCGARAGEHHRLADGGGGLRSSTHEQILRFNLCQDIIVLEERLMEGLYACLRLAVVNYQRHVNLRKMKACHMLEARHEYNRRKFTSLFCYDECG